MKRFYSRLNNFSVRPRARQRILSPSAIPNPNVPTSLSLNGLLQEPTLIISRQIEYANLLLGYEQANKYSIRSTTDQQLALMCEQGEFLKTVLARQILRTRRPMEVDIVNNTGEMLMKIQRPLQWFLNSHLTVYDHHGVPLGACRSDWHIWRRRYDLYAIEVQTYTHQQFARIDSGFWAWDFMVQDARGRVLGTISRNFTNFAREIFTDTGQYVVNFGANTTMQQRAVIFGTAISIDVDYFSRHSEHHGGAGFMFMPWATSGGQDEN